MIQKFWVFFGVFLFSGCSSPKAFFDLKGEDLIAPVTVRPKNLSKNAQTFHWDFGNGLNSKDVEAGCKYLFSGTYNISLTVTKGKKQSTFSNKITILPPLDCLVEMETTSGTMLMRLFNETPLHRDNFIRLADLGFYEGQLFHRVIPGFMIQAGDPDSKNVGKEARLGSGGPSYTIPSEIHSLYFHTKGVMAAARVGDEANPGKESSGSQFYIVHGRPMDLDQLAIYEAQKGIYYPSETRALYKTKGGAPQLDMEYTIFGEVIEGLEVIDHITSTPTDMYDRPKNDVRIIKVTVIK